MRTGHRAKVLPIGLLSELREQFARTGATVGLCHGCFDILHSGHVHHFHEAAAHVDVLVVSMTAAVHIHKGPDRPVFGDEARLATVSALAAVDYVVLNEGETATPLIRRLRPDVYFKGADYTAGDDVRLLEELEAVRETGGRFVVTDGSVFDSSSRAARLLSGTVT